MATYNGYYIRKTTGAVANRTNPNPIGEVRKVTAYTTAATRIALATTGEVRPIIRVTAAADRQLINVTQNEVRSVVGIVAERPNINNIQLLFPRVIPVDYSWTKNIK